MRPLIADARHVGDLESRSVPRVGEAVAPAAQPAAGNHAHASPRPRRPASSATAPAARPRRPGTPRARGVAASDAGRGRGGRRAPARGSASACGRPFEEARERRRRAAGHVRRQRRVADALHHQQPRPRQLGGHAAGRLDRGPQVVLALHQQRGHVGQRPGPGRGSHRRLAASAGRGRRCRSAAPSGDRRGRRPVSGLEAAAAAACRRRSANGAPRDHGSLASSQVVAAYSAVLSSRGSIGPPSSANERRLRRSSGAVSPRTADRSAPGRAARRPGSKSPESSTENSPKRSIRRFRRRPRESTTRPVSGPPAKRWTRRADVGRRVEPEPGARAPAQLRQHARDAREGAAVERVGAVGLHDGVQHHAVHARRVAQRVCGGRAGAVGDAEQGELGGAELAGGRRRGRRRCRGSCRRRGAGRGARRSPPRPRRRAGCSTAPAAGSAAARSGRCRAGRPRSGRGDRARCRTASSESKPKRAVADWPGPPARATSGGLVARRLGGQALHEQRHAALHLSGAVERDAQPGAPEAQLAAALEPQPGVGGRSGGQPRDQRCRDDDRQAPHARSIIGR